MLWCPWHRVSFCTFLTLKWPSPITFLKHMFMPWPDISGLLAENNRLNEEKREIAKQHATETEQLSTRVRELEEQIEELESDHYQRLEDKKAEVEDLEKQIEVLDKKLKSNQQFLEVGILRNWLQINSLGPGDTIWWQRSGSRLDQIMACCLMASSHYLNQCWLVIHRFQWNSPERNWIGHAQEEFNP